LPGWYGDGWSPGDPTPLVVAARTELEDIDWGVSGLLLTTEGPYGVITDVQYRITTEGWPDTLLVDAISEETFSFVPEGRHKVGLKLTDPDLNAVPPDSSEVVRTLAGELASVGFHLAEGATVTGAVRGSEGESLVWDPLNEAAEVCDTLGSSVKRGSIDTLGEYSIAGLPEGHYLMRIRPPASSGYRPTWYPSSVDVGSAERIRLTPPEVREGIDVYLQAE
jgi:hypothetical protein